MGDRILEGLWDCPYCGTKAIGGLTKHCPNCGHPQDEGTKFYLGEKKNYLNEDIAKDYGKGADWTCPYCGSLNRYHFKYCANCGSSKEESQSDYFENQVKNEEKEKRRQAEINPHLQNKQNRRNQKNSSNGGEEESFWSLLKACIFSPLTIGIVLLLGLFVFWLMPKNATVQVTDKNWGRSVEVEDYLTVQEQDFSVPPGGRVYHQEEAIHHYEKVIDHYETKTRQVSESVYDHDEVHYETRDNGDGTFTESTYTTPVYRTETHTETYQDPVYRDEPVYQTLYYYDIDKWVVVRTETSEGGDEEPYWPELHLTGNEREGSRYDYYSFSAKDVKKDHTYHLELPQEEWEKLKIGSEIDITYGVGGDVKKINGVEISY